MKDKMWIVTMGANCSVDWVEKMYIFAPNRWKAWRLLKTMVKPWVNVQGMRRATEQEERAWPNKVY